MERTVLRKLQLTQLEIAREIKRVCEKNGIRYFLCCGSFLGAVRHQGFIPWDDDLDIGMLRQDYVRFCELAPKELDSRFCLQNWHTDPDYSLPFAKVRLRNTLLLENKSAPLAENGIYVDIFPFDNAPEEPSAQRAMARRLVTLFRLKLMKSGMRPWMEGDRLHWKKRVGYLPYQLLALMTGRESLIRRFEEIAGSAPRGKLVCRQRAWSRLDCYQRAWCEELGEYSFEGELFPGPRDYDSFLSAIYGDYMTLPPEDQREDRHQILRLRFGDGTEEWVKK